MRITIGKNKLEELIKKQLENFFLFEKKDNDSLNNIIDKALENINYSFSHSKKKYYEENGEVIFSPFNSNQYTIFLYYLSRQAFLSSNRDLADKIYYLNKTLNSVDLFYEVELPEIFMLDHPLGTVIGRAKFSDFFLFSQGCTIGNNGGKYPQIGQHVYLMSDAKIIGDSKIGNYVIISANTYVKDQNIPDLSIVFNDNQNPGKLIIKPITKQYFVENFNYFKEKN